MTNQLVLKLTFRFQATWQSQAAGPFRIGGVYYLHGAEL